MKPSSIYILLKYRNPIVLLQPKFHKALKYYLLFKWKIVLPSSRTGGKSTELEFKCTSCTWSIWEHRSRKRCGTNESQQMHSWHSDQACGLCKAHCYLSLLSMLLPLLPTSVSEDLGLWKGGDCSASAVFFFNNLWLTAHKLSHFKWNWDYMQGVCMHKQFPTLEIVASFQEQDYCNISSVEIPRTTFHVGEIKFTWLKIINNNYD